MVTSRDVARLAGVSQPTVSRALRGDTRISSTTRERVLDAAAALHYVPNERGRSLVTRRSGRIAVVASELGNTFYPALLAPIVDSLDAAGYTSVVITAPNDGDPQTSVLLDGSVDGVVLTASHLGSTLPARLVANQVPHVFVNRGVTEPLADTCAPDNVDGARQVAALIRELGHRRVGIISGPATTSTARERTAAFTQELADGGVAVGSEYIGDGPFSTATGEQQLERMLSLPQPPTAVFCVNDVIAIGALNAARRLGVSVPAELTVVGFDDIPQAEWAIVGLTTVRVDLHRMAATAVGMLIAQIESEPAGPRQEIVPVDLVLRATHAAPRG